MKKRTVILLAVAVVMVAAAGGYFLIDHNLKQLASVSIPQIDPAALGDGVYEGSYSVFPVSAKVEVTISGHKIVNIVIKEHKNGKGSTAEVLPQNVMEAQSLQVDVVSGATYSSKVILLAIEDALSHPAK